LLTNSVFPPCCEFNWSVIFASEVRSITDRLLGIISYTLKANLIKALQFCLLSFSVISIASVSLHHSPKHTLIHRFL